MKNRLKRFFNFYFNTWWCPLLIAVFVSVVFIIYTDIAFGFIEYYPYGFISYSYSTIMGRIVGCILFGIEILGLILFCLSILGIPIAWVCHLCRKRWREAFLSFFVPVAIVFFFLLFLLN